MLDFARADNKGKNIYTIINKITAKERGEGADEPLQPTSPSPVAFDHRENAISIRTHLRHNHFRGRIVPFSAIAPCIGTNATYCRGGRVGECLWIEWERSW